MKKAIARFIPPQRDKGFSFQVVFKDNDLPETWEFVGLFADPDVKAAGPYLQGHSGNWAMVEFWVANDEEGEKIARKAAEVFAKHFELEMKDGDFTRADLGLE